MQVFAESREPLYSRIIQDLAKRIQSKEWDLNDQLPTEDELEAQYQASRGTVRRALYELELDGYITRMAGRGTFVKRLLPRMEKNLGLIKSFTQQLEDMGLKPRTRVVEVQEMRASEAGDRVVKGFGISGKAKVVKVTRLRMAEEDIPFAIQTVYLSNDLCENLVRQDFSNLFDFYSRVCRRSVATAIEELSLGKATQTEARMLKIHKNDPVIIRDRVSYDQMGNTLEVLHSVDRGDRFLYKYYIAGNESVVALSPGAEAELGPARRRQGKNRAA